MKMIKKLLMGVTLLTFGLGINYVHAQSYVFHKDGGDAIGVGEVDAGITITSNGKTSDYHIYNYYVNNNTKIYCMDPALDNNYDGNLIYDIATYDFSDATSGNINTAAKYYALYSVVDKTNATTKGSGNIAQTDTALRILYNIFILPMDSNFSQWKLGRDAIINYGIDIVTDESIAMKTASLLDACSSSKNVSAAQSCVKNTIQRKYGFGISNARLNVPSNLANGDNGIKTLVTEAIKKAYDFKQNGARLLNVKTSVNSESVESKVQTGNGEEKYIMQEIKTVNFRIENVPSGGWVKIKPSDITCENCQGITTNIEYRNGDNWVKMTGEIELQKYLKNNTAQVRITLTKNTPQATCNPIKLKVNYRTYDPRLHFEVKVLNSNPRLQKYLTFLNISSDDGQAKTLNVSSNVGCLNQVCESTLETPVCSDENTYSQIKAPTNIKSCVIDNVDSAGNSYKLSTLNEGVDNKYCSTYCKEDYAKISLNKRIRDINCGGYLQLRAEIIGSQDCYRAGATADKSINKANFINDIVEIQRKYIDAYNLYQKATNAGARGISRYENTYYVRGSYSGIAEANVSSDGLVTHKGATYNYDYTGSSEKAVKDAIQKDLDSAKNSLNKDTGLYKDYTKAINDYNACTSSWENEFKFDQKVYWYYDQEDYYSLLDADKRYLNPVGEKQNSVKIEACTGNTDNDYNTCSTGWTSINNVSSAYKFRICSIENGQLTCTDDTKQISNAKFVRQHSEAAQSYENPLVFYQVATSGPSSGKITTNGSYKGPNVQTTLVNGLPVSLNSTNMGNFILLLDDFGSFYDRNESGRLFDYQNEILSNNVSEFDYGKYLEQDTVAYAQKDDIKTWNGTYKCDYVTTCRDEDCPTCDFVCENPDGTECEWRNCPTCDTECVNCLFNLNKLQLNFKPISTSKFDSAGREYGYNWNVNTNLAKLELVKSKADETIKEIEESNTTIYDDTKDEDNKNLSFSITMTPNVTSYIREKNKEIDAENTGGGGYANDSLTCYDYEDSNKAIQKNVFCYSDFIDDLISNYSNEIYAKNRDDVGNRAKSDTDRTLKNLDYWTPWPDYKYDESVIGGPSWK